MEIQSLTAEIQYLDQRMTQSLDYYEYDFEYSENGINYLAIGNSLTLISSWSRGICSTKPDNDYFHLVVSKLEEQFGNVTAYPYNFSTWERLDNKEKAYSLLECCLSEKLDIISIQLGENLANITSYEQDLNGLVQFIKTKVPDAKIVIIGDWWSQDRNTIRENVAASNTVLFADLSEIIGDEKYQSITGTECELEDGSVIEVSEVAHTHPGDLGMKYIADKVIDALKIDNK